MENDKKRSFHVTFITGHYVYLLLWIFVGSILIYPAKHMKYIDALFFASGACTQSGLNTIDVNLISTYQQVIIYLLPMFTNPIFINTCVVFIRLYWFEKRFQHIVSSFRSPSKGRTTTATERDGDLDGAERGIRGRQIKVLRPNSKDDEGLNGGLRPSDTGSGESSHSSKPSVARNSRSRSPSPRSPLSESNGPPRTAQSNQNIQFVDLPVPPSKERQDSSRESDDARNSTNQHIVFVENQRRRSHSKALRIPGPREFERGDRAQEVDDDDTHTLNHVRTTDDKSHDIGHAPARSYSMQEAGTNASGTLRMRKLPTIDRVLPRVATVEQALSAAFTVGSKRPSFSRRPTTKERAEMPYLSYAPTIGRNSQFVNLTPEQRDELGGIEYRSLKLLTKILVGYFVFWHVFGVLCFLPWIYNSPSHLAYVRSVGQNPSWWAIFSAETTFNDVGFTLTPDSMISFQDCSWTLLSMTYLIIIGNTGFPCLLRFTIWALFKLVPKNSSYKETLNFLLDHPRRCFTLLFPSRETWVLFFVLVCMNVLDVILFIALDINNVAVKDIPVGNRIVVAIFQAASTRTSGTSAVNLAEVHPAVQVSYMVMMYISVFPIAISVRRTNVYEERSLGVYSGDDEEDGSKSFVGTHLRKQLSFDLWYIFLGLFIICIAEGKRLQSPTDVSFSIFAVLFEVVSAYGTVGLSLGYPTINASFSTEFNTFSRIIVMAMQVRGRHRGLPYELDRAILLPKDTRDNDMVSIRRRSSTINMSRPPTIGRPYSQRVPSQAIEDD